MLRQHQVADLSWHPLRDVGRRGPNYALSVLGHQEGGIVYLMACGHESVPNHARCRHDCGRDPPNWRAPYVLHEDWRAAAKRMDRYGIRGAEDFDRLPRDLRPPGGRFWFYRENEIAPRTVA